MLNSKTNAAKRVSAFLLAVLMLVGTLPLNVLAEGMQNKATNTVVADSKTEKEPTTGSKKHTIHFNPNGGSGEMKDVEVADGETYSLPKNKFKAPEGKEFKNWLVEKDEFKEGHSVVVDKDLEVKANWEGVKVGPVKKALSSLLRTNNDGIEIGDAKVPDAVMAGGNTTEGDPEGTVTSKDGKTRITMFDVSWVGTNERIRTTNLDKDLYPKYQAELKWAISGEREYKPGTVRINMTNKVFIGEKQKYHYYPDFEDMPVPKAVLKEDGSIDFDADYEKSDFVYVENDDNTISLVNIVTLQPGNHGNYTITYTGDENKDPKKDSRYEFDSGDIGNLNSFISVLLDNKEVVEKNAKPLYIKAEKKPGLFVSKYNKVSTTWPLSKIQAPKDSDKYIYVKNIVYLMPLSYFNYDLQVSDVIQKPQELVGYTKLATRKYYKSYPDIDNINSDDFIKADSETLNLTFNDILGSGPDGVDSLRVSGYRFRGLNCFYILTRVPKSISDDGAEHIFKNTVNATATTKEKTPRTLTSQGSYKDRYQKIRFSVPGNEFSGNKMAQGHERIGAIDRLLGGNSQDLAWYLDKKSKAMALTYDPDTNQPDNVKSYGIKKYKQVVSDDYLFLDDDLTKPLTNEDIEITDFSINLEPYTYLESDGGRGWVWSDYRKDSKGEFFNTVYGKESPNGQWKKLFEYEGYHWEQYNSITGKIELKKTTKFFNGTSIEKGVIVPPKGMICLKLETETNCHGLGQRINVMHKLKPTERVLSYARKQNELQKDIKVLNFGSTAVYNSNGKLVSGSKTGWIRDNLTDLDNKVFGEPTPHISDQIRLTKAIKQAELYHYDYNYGEKTAYVKTQNDEKNKQFKTTWQACLEEKSVGEKNEDYKNNASGIFYVLLPKGTAVDAKSVRVLSLDLYNWKGLSISLSEAVVPNTHKIIPNYKNTGRDLLIVSYQGELNKDLLNYRWKDYGEKKTEVYLQYDTVYSWDSYKDNGSDLRSLIAYESVNGKIASGFRDDPTDYKGGFNDRKYLIEGTVYTDKEKEIMKDLNSNNDNPAFLYLALNSKAVGNTIANTGLSKHVKGPQDIRYTTKTKVKEGDSYSYRLRLASQLGTSTSNIILYDTIEDYTLLESDEDHGIKSWKGALESIDVSQPEFKGIDPVIYYSTVPNLKIRKPDPKSSVPVEQQENTVNLSDKKIWTKEKPADLSKVTAIAVDLSKDKKGQPYVLKENESVVVNLNMKAPWNMKEHNIGTTDKAFNEIYANTTVTTNLDSKSENELINTAYTAVGLEPVITEAPIKAIKKHLDKEGKDIALKANEFTFELQDAEGNPLQTKSNDEKGNITFDPIKYNSWDVGEHTYKIVEVKGESDTTAYDNHEEIVKVKVERSGASELKATITYDEDGAIFTNREMDPIGTSIEAKKIYIGKGGLEEKPKAKEFEFILKDAQGNEINRTTNDAEGKVTFKELTYKPNQLGEHKYTIEEVKGNNPAIDYDTTKKNVTVNVSLTEDFKLKADVVYKGGTVPTFTNTLKSASLQLVKLKDESDSFVLEEVKDANGFVTSYKVPEAQKDKVLDGAEYKLYKIESDGTKTFIDTLITKSGISQVVQDILPGKYKLKETKAPEGYLLNAKDLKFEITEKDAGTIVAKFATDNKIVDMPSTGGQGTEAFMIGGGILLMTMAGAFYVANKKKEQRSK